MRSSRSEFDTVNQVAPAQDSLRSPDLLEVRITAQFGLHLQDDQTSTTNHLASRSYGWNRNVAWIFASILVLRSVG
jgi:hypothetical protein